VPPRTRARYCKRGHDQRVEARPNGKGCGACHRELERERYLGDVEGHRARAREYARANRERAVERHRAWRRAHPDHVRSYGLQRHYLRQVGRDAPLSYVELLQGDPCAYCGGPSEVLDHIEPVAGGGSSSWTNVTAACGECNGSKYVRPLLRFLLASDRMTVPARP
jgi:5-methylcytosine-specific restriction endonuclease McrA